MYGDSCGPELGGDGQDLYVSVADSSAPGGQNWVAIGSNEAFTETAAGQNSLVIYKIYKFL